MAKVFVIGGKYAGQNLLLMNRYKFVDGVHLEEDEDTAKMKSTVLCSFYPCKMMEHDEYVKNKDKIQADAAAGWKKPEPAAAAAAAPASKPPAGVVPTQSVSTAKG